MTDLPKVYCWCNSGAGTDFQVWVAMADDGDVIKSHVCSDHSWAEHDLHSGFGRDLFAKKFGGYGDGEFYEIVWAVPPQEVYERNQALAAAHEARGTEGDE